MQKLALIFHTPEGSFTEKLDAGHQRRWVLGRSSMYCDIPVRHPFISKRHSRITATPTDSTEGGTPQWRWELWDEGSRNGTLLNGRRLSVENERSQKGHLIEEGDKIHLANQLITVTFDLDDTTGIPRLSEVEPDLDTPEAAPAPTLIEQPPHPKTGWDVLAQGLPWFQTQPLFKQVVLLFVSGLLFALLLWIWRTS